MVAVCCCTSEAFVVGLLSMLRKLSLLFDYRLLDYSVLLLVLSVAVEVVCPWAEEEESHPLPLP